MKPVLHEYSVGLFSVTSLSAMKRVHYNRMVDFLCVNRLCCVNFISAPEVLAQKPYSKAVDCWSIGVISYIL